MFNKIISLSFKLNNVNKIIKFNKLKIKIKKL